MKRSKVSPRLEKLQRTMSGITNEVNRLNTLETKVNEKEKEIQKLKEELSFSQATVSQLRKENRKFKRTAKYLEVRLCMLSAPKVEWNEEELTSANCAKLKASYKAPIVEEEGYEGGNESSGEEEERGRLPAVVELEAEAENGMRGGSNSNYEGKTLGTKQEQNGRPTNAGRRAQTGKGTEIRNMWEHNKAHMSSLKASASVRNPRRKFPGMTGPPKKKQKDH